MGNLRICIFGVVVGFVASCGDNGAGSGIADQCNPLGGQTCMLPWPSMAFTTADATSATGIRVDAPIEAMPKNGDNISIDPKRINRWDGFSPTGPMLAIFPKGVAVANLPSFKDPSESLATDSPIVVLDIDTGERAPFFAEIDANFAADPGSSALIIRPLMRLHEKSHYAVAIRTAVKAADGSDLVATPAFIALRDGTSFDHPRFAAMQAGAPAMFAALETAGVPKTDLVLAWEFVTASDQFLQSDLTTMRDAGVAAIGTNGANLSFVATEQPPINGIYKAYVGTYKSPNFLTDAENDDSIFTRGADGLPMMTGLRDANFAALIPSCVTSQPGPHATIVFGHGLFGSAKEYLADSFTQDLAEKYCFIIIAGDFIGLTSRQLTLASLSVNDLNVGYGITEKLGQSILDFIALENAVRGPMATAPEFQYNNMPVIDPAHTYYIGGSLGGIMGNVFMAYDPNITRGVLAVPGGVWSLLFERSNAWSLLQGALMGSYTDPKEYQLIIAMFGMAFEPYDSITTAAHVIKDPLPGVPVKNILMWYSMGDCLVNNLTTEMVARTMGITMLSPNVKQVWGMTPAPGPMTNGINVFNDHPTPLPPDVNIPPATDNGTHSGINRKAAALREVEAFILGTQMAKQTCFAADGTTPAACDCATGACD